MRLTYDVARDLQHFACVEFLRLIPQATSVLFSTLSALPDRLRFRRQRAREDVRLAAISYPYLARKLS